MSNSYLMCAPSYFTVEYVINPWMKGNVHGSSIERAKQEWQALFNIISKHATVELVPPQPGVPDMPFSANAGLVLGDRIVLSRFLYPERQGEEPHFEEWFCSHNFAVLKLPKNIPFEGAGDALLDRKQSLLWMGYGHRSSRKALTYIADWLQIDVQLLKLSDERFYHLDTCFCPLSGGYVMYFPPAFDKKSQKAIEDRVPEKLRIVVEEADALNFACNAVNIDGVVIMNQASDILVKTLEAKKFRVFQTPLSEFMKAGGSAKCLTLRMNEPRLLAKVAK